MTISNVKLNHDELGYAVAEGLPIGYDALHAYFKQEKSKTTIIKLSDDDPELFFEWAVLDANEEPAPVSKWQTPSIIDSALIAICKVDEVGPCAIYVSNT